uniref:Uncharacterized protein n=1 Tax=Anopheles minimus TaxID=112268 RepID=A0A182WF11_9DIPT
MANVLQELLNVCRFCLCENKQHLKPILETLDSSVTADEIERYTGIQVHTDEDCSLYAICVECTSKLRNSIQFRQKCLSNQTHFEELLMMLVASTESIANESAESEKEEDSADDPIHVDLTVFMDLVHDEDSSSEPIHNPNNTHPSEPNEASEDDDMYCANYIEPGKSYDSDRDDIWETTPKETKKPRKKYTYKKFDCTVKEPVVQERVRKKKTYEFEALTQSQCYFVKTFKDVKRMYLKSLCEICGKLVTSFTAHMGTHVGASLHSCPHCTVKMKSRNNLSAHIKTVHYKIVGKTCNICGKGFVHHKTYRYHMLAHESEGKAFECKPCAKKFDKPFGLRDHYNRIDAIDTDQRTVHAICFECTSKLKMSAAFRKICISNDYLFHQLWSRSRANSKSTTVEAVEYLYDSDADPLEVEFLVDDIDAFDGSASIQQDLYETNNQHACDSYPNGSEGPPVEDEHIYESNSSGIESRSSHHIRDGSGQQSVATNTNDKQLLVDETLYSANYIELGEPYSENEEPDLYRNEVRLTNRTNSYLHFIRSLPRSERRGADANSVKRSILFRRTNRKRGKPLCDTCGKLVSNLASHITSHTEEINHACPHCPIKMKHSSYLMRHIQAVHLKTAVKSCTTCNMNFTHYTTYRSHMYTEHGVGKLHECLVCSRGFPDACRLRKHMKRFHNTEEHNCEDCGKIFRMREHLEKHRKRVHTKEQPYVCSQCPKRFKCARYRKNHELAHHSGIVFECSFCEKSFRHKYLVNGHIRKMHPEAHSETVTQQEPIAYNEKYLIPILKILDSTLTTDDVERFTGIQINTDDDVLYAVCLECTNSMKNSATFRTTCLNNNSVFYELSTVLVTSEESIYGETIEYLESEFEAEDVKDLVKNEEKPFTDFSVEPIPWRPKSSPQHAYEEEYIQDSQDDTVTSINEEQLTNEDGFPYSANRIEPGESLSDEDMFAPNFFTQAYYKKPKKRPKDESLRGKRKLHLCNWCGIFVHHIPSHVLIHREEATYSCPHCPVKMKQKGNLSQHIQTVHFKTVGKKCEICGKGFIHHKTYRYHMRTHQDAGESFECQLNDDQLYSYAVCYGCSKNLEMMGDFRELCLSNDAYFRQLCAVQDTKAVPALIEIEFVPSVTFKGDSVASPNSSEKDDHCSVLDGNVEREEDSEEYSIQPPVPSPSKAKRDPANLADEYRNTNRPRNGNTQRTLCDMCGKMVTNIGLHISSHTKQTNYVCPHCPTKMNHPANLMRHIRAVHLKTIVKSCDLCGKGFTHKNTYKSHLRSQHDIGESYNCKVCTKQFKYASGLRDHMLRFHTSDSSYECVVCAKIFKTKQALKEHENVHTNEKPHGCKHCSKRFKSRSARNTHQLTHSGIVFSCRFCDKSYRYKNLLNIHVRNQNEKILIPLCKALNASLGMGDVERFTGIQIKPEYTSLYMMCFECTRMLKKSSEYRESCISNDVLFRELFVKIEYDESCDDYEGAHCSKEETISIELVLPYDDQTQFEEQREEDGGNASCNEEDETTDAPHMKVVKYETVKTGLSDDEQHENAGISSSADTLDRKPVRHVSKIKSKSSKPGSQPSKNCSRAKQLCVTCGKLVNNLARHQQSHTMGIKRACPHCPVEMVDHSNLLRHIEAVHLKKVVKTCEKCGQGFTHNNTYKSHMRSRHGIGETYKCLNCQKEFNHPGGLRDHCKRFHSNDFNFDCVTCGKRFKLKQELRVHERVHSTEKPYACSLCPKRFKSGFAKKTHELTHSGISFECTICNKSYRYKSLLSMHNRKMHPEQNAETGETG